MATVVVNSHENGLTNNNAVTPGEAPTTTEDEWESGNSTAKLFERSRIKALCGTLLFILHFFLVIL